LTESDTPRIRIGISSCLLGQEVRYDGGHKHSGYITETLARYFEFVPFCPEVAIGLGIPRPPIHLVLKSRGVRAVGVEDPSVDVTDALAAYGETVAVQLADFSGYIFKMGSPSCGMEGVNVSTEQGSASGSGTFSRTIMSALPHLPTEEEGRLMDPALRENFIERVFVYRRWRDLLAAGLTATKLAEFHAAHEFIILAHDETRCRSLARWVAQAGADDLPTLSQEYAAELMAALKHRATRETHANVLMRVAGFLKEHIDAQDEEELLEIIRAYGLGQLPLIVPITLVKHHLRRFPNPYLYGQYYLNPHPTELMLRNSV
jgi:uncharacterized protein YbgA (DUF1722 family)/uncharacterized protein YbbK (DUF523 family)